MRWCPGFFGTRCAAGGRRPRRRTLRPMTMTTGAFPSLWLQAGCDTQSHPAGQQWGGDGSSASEAAAPSARPKRTPAVRLMWSRPEQMLRHDATSIRRGRSPSTSGVMAVTVRHASVAAAESSGTASPNSWARSSGCGCRYPLQRLQRGFAPIASHPLAASAPLSHANGRSRPIRLPVAGRSPRVSGSSVRCWSMASSWRPSFSRCARNRHSYGGTQPICKGGSAPSPASRARRSSALRSACSVWRSRSPSSSRRRSSGASRRCGT